MAEVIIVGGVEEVQNSDGPADVVEVSQDAEEGGAE